MTVDHVKPSSYDQGCTYRLYANGDCDDPMENFCSHVKLIIELPRPAIPECIIITGCGNITHGTARPRRLMHPTCRYDLCAIRYDHHRGQPFHNTNALYQWAPRFSIKSLKMVLFFLESTLQDSSVFSSKREILLYQVVLYWGDTTMLE